MRHHYPPPPDKLVDQQGRPYFLWDVNLSIDAFREKVRDTNPDVRAMWIGKLMRQAKPDDVFLFVGLEDIRRDWARLVRHLGQTLSFWTWLLARWEVRGDESRT